MGYQALLFCPDEKTARTVTQVLSELDFSVIPCTEPFAAVKKLMGEHFDAVVVDCDNEQNATLLFKSARNAPTNHSSLAVAVVEGQAGVAKAFRIGANLVLTKPVNVEQAKGTLRVARGLLRKSEAARPATGGGTTGAKPAAPVVAPPKPALHRPFPTVATSGAAAAIAPSAAATSIPAQKEAPRPTFVASDPTEIGERDSGPFVATNSENASPSMVAPEVNIAANKAEIPSRPVGRSSSLGGFGGGAASAPAPAREPKSSVAETESPVDEAAANADGLSVEGTPAPAPSFTLGGNVKSEAETAGAKRKKVLLAVAAGLLVAAVGYEVWMQWVSSSGAATPFTHVAQPATTSQKSPQAAPNSAPIAPSSVASSSVASSSLPSSTDGAPATVAKATARPESAQPLSRPENEAPAVSRAERTAERAIVVKNHPAQPSVGKSAPSEDVTAPTLAGIAPGNSAALPNLVGNDKAPTPVLQDLHISQGVSRGLLVKEIPPAYPVSALRMHIEGAVELLATISKSGDISTVKVLSGDPQLSHAAVEAVKRWKYKPYLLNGEPVEIQTPVTVKFKLPR